MLRRDVFGVVVQAPVELVLVTYVDEVQVHVLHVRTTISALLDDVARGGNIMSLRASSPSASV